MACAWRNFKIIFSRPLLIIIFRPKILVFVTYSILTGQIKVEFVIYWVLKFSLLFFIPQYCNHLKQFDFSPFILTSSWFRLFFVFLPNSNQLYMLEVEYLKWLYLVHTTNLNEGQIVSHILQIWHFGLCWPFLALFG